MRERRSNGRGSGEEIGGVGCGGMGDERGELRGFNHGEQATHVAVGICFPFWLVTFSSRLFRFNFLFALVGMVR